jgi:rubrerythrin
MMKELKNTKTHENLKSAFATESQANRRYLYFARVADIEGYPEIGGLFRDTSEAETGHAFGHMDFLKAVGDPATGVAFGNTRMNLQSSIEGETYEYTQMYPGMARIAREEGFPEIAEWFETLAKAERSHAGRFTKGFESLKEL